MFDNEELRRLKVMAEQRPAMNIDVMQDALFGEENTRRQMVTKIDKELIIFIKSIDQYHC